MSYALQLGTDGHVDFTENAGLQAASSLAVTLYVRGATFNDPSANVVHRLFQVGDDTHLKLAAFCHHYWGGTRLMIRTPNGSGGGNDSICDGSADLGTVTEDGGLYRLVVALDPSASSDRIAWVLYDVDDVTVLAYYNGNNNSTQDPMPTDAGAGLLALGFLAGGSTGQTWIIADATVRNYAGTATYATVPLEEGDGDSVSETTGNTTGTVDGTYEWISSEPHGALDMPLPLVLDASGTVPLSENTGSFSHALPLTLNASGTTPLGPQYALELASGARVDFANDAAMAAATRIYGAFSCLGESLKDLESVGGVQSIDCVMDATPTYSKVGLLWAGGQTSFAVGDPGNYYWFNYHLGKALSELSSGTYYDCAWWYDPTATPQAGLTVYAQGDLGGTPVAQWWTQANVDALSTDSARGCRHLFGPFTFDWAKIGDSGGYAFATAPLNEGQGTDVIPDGAISGTYAWLPLTLAHHGVVALSDNPVAVGETGTATVEWRDENDEAMDPQPGGTLWDSDSAGATIDPDTGGYEGVANGEVTLSARLGAIVASADLTITPAFKLVGSMTTP